MSKYSGADWLRYFRPDLSEFGTLVADILGQAFQGLYHEQNAVTNKKVDWSSDRWIAITICGSISTFDDSRLTLLVLLCHRYGVRMEISGASSRYMRLAFSPRTIGLTGPLWKRQPTIEQMIERSESTIAAIQKESAVEVAS